MILSDAQLKNHFDGEIARWFANKGDYTHRLNYNLNGDSVLLDLGGYQGWWTDEMFKKYACNVHVFEPVKKFYDGICDKFKNVDKIKCYNYGLGANDGTVDIVHAADGTSIYLDAEDGTKESIYIRRAEFFINELNANIDVMKINIEGSEYELLEHLIDTGSITKLKNVQVQFHTFMTNAQKRRNLIIEKMSKTHKLTYNYDFVWENWELL